MIDRETVQKIKDAANIVDVVSDYVHLVRRGANYMGLCPFHNERTPSFSVSPKKNFCHCFSCRKGGSPVNFLMEKEGISYYEALLRLAKKYNIKVEEKELTDEERQKITERESMFVASEWAMNYFHDNLYNTQEGRDVGLSYLYGRGITDEAIRKYKLGYSIDRGSALLNKAKNEGFDIEVFKKIGLIGTSQDGRDYDKFRGRVMFPIRNSAGKPIAFGGRALKGEPAKYINSPETPIYKKSYELYGISEAKNEIVNKERVFLMEGYLDVIGSWQAGLKNVVASSGTSLTDGQISLIHRFTDNVTLIYDGDSAGIKASLRGIDMLLSHNLHVNVLLLPPGEDPDSFARKVTPEEFKDYIEKNSSDFIEFKSRVLLQNAGENLQERSKAVESVVESIACIPNEIERTVYIQKCSLLMNMDERVITQNVNRKILNRLSDSKKRYPDSQTAPRQATPAAGQVLKPSETAQPTEKENDANLHIVRHEEEIIKYCIRYAFLPADELNEEDIFDPHDQLTAIEYIEDELSADGIEISHPTYALIFSNLLSQLDEFKRRYTSLKSDIEADQKKKAEEFFNKLGMAGGSMSTIQKAEKEFELQQIAEMKEQLKRFSQKFSVDFLINHEDNGVRNITTPLVEDRHILSSIYTQAGHFVVHESDKLPDLLLRALTELRSEILNERIKTLNEKIKNAVSNGDQEQQIAMMHELSKLMHLRSRLAENLGERIISPR